LERRRRTLQGTWKRLNDHPIHAMVSDHPGAEVRLNPERAAYTDIPNKALQYVWNACGTDHEIGRSRDMSAALRCIEFR
jgi:hypothetical protein